MRERDIERYLAGLCTAHGGVAWKWVSPGRRGVPDRIIVLPGGRVMFAEVKAPGGRTTVLQQRVHARLRALGAVVEVVDSIEAVDTLLGAVR